jgi:hypothetical protein
VTWNSHGMEDQSTVTFTTTGALPTGLSASTVYYILNKTANTFQVSATPGGSAINTSGSQSGTHTVYSSRVRAAGISLQDGRYCKTSDKTRLYLGTFRTTSTTTTENSGGNLTPSVGGKRFLWNLYNQVDHWLGVHEDGNWNYSTADWRIAAGNANNIVECVVGVVSPYTASVHVYLNSTTAANVAVSIGIDQTSASEWPGYGSGLPANVGMGIAHDIGGWLSEGHHYMAWIEIGFGSGSQQWYGFGAPQVHSGMRAMVKM